MTWNAKGSLAIGLVILLAAGIGIGMSLNTPTAAQQATATSGPARFTVVETDGLSLIVTDNHKNTVFFYTVDEGAKPGADLQLRGTVDLNHVGQATLKPTLLNPKK